MLNGDLAASESQDAAALASQVGKQHKRGEYVAIRIGLARLQAGQKLDAQTIELLE